MAMKHYRKDFTLIPENIDSAADFADETLQMFSLPRKEVLRIRLSLEEILLRWYDNVSNLKDKFTVDISRRFGRITLTVSCNGMPCDPLAAEDEDESFGSGALGRAMLTNLGLSPTWQYQNGSNTVSFSIKKKQKLSQLSLVLIAVVSALVLGWLGLLLPEGLRTTILTTLLDPLFNTFLSVFSCIVGPLMFLSMVWGIVNIGDTRQLGRIGKKLLGRYMIVSIIVGIVCMIAAVSFFKPTLSGAQSGQAVLQSVIEMVLDIIPGNIVEPFLTGNTLQILFMGAVVGIVMILLRDRMQTLTQIVEQSNAVVQVILSAISSITPGFIFLSVLRLLLQGTLAQSAAGLISVILLSVVLSAAEILIEIVTMMKLGVSPVQAMRKLSSTFLIALTTASSAAAFPTMIDTCHNKLGIEEKLTSFALPFGSVVFMPHAVNLFILVPLFAAQLYGVELTAGSIVLCVINAVVLSVAAPPIPGGAISCYTLMFLQLGVPLEAISLAAAANVVLDFTATSGNIMALMIQTSHGASKLDMLNHDIIRKNN
ncbi:MAG: cation:dicarboxylase symporter family transporter [Firmicutes bacterium]|nr:cation:dicarboxylase symporter family transporter [Bacillota bacterium]